MSRGVQAMTEILQFREMGLTARRAVSGLSATKMIADKLSERFRGFCGKAETRAEIFKFFRNFLPRCWVKTFAEPASNPRFSGS